MAGGYPIMLVLIALTSGPGERGAADSDARIRIAVLPAQVAEASREIVPEIIDDYVLTAVQNSAGQDVIGREDVNALLGFERDKELLGCDDATCFAEVGGALGADRLVVVKVEMVSSEWAVTAKLIDVRAIRVESRSTDFVTGDAAALLRAVPALIGDLFGVRPPTPDTPAHETPAPISPETSPFENVHDFKRQVALGRIRNGQDEEGLDDLRRLCIHDDKLSCQYLHDAGELGALERGKRGWGIALIVGGTLSLAGGLAILLTPSIVMASEEEDYMAGGVFAAGGAVAGGLGALTYAIGYRRLKRARALLDESAGSSETTSPRVLLEVTGTHAGVVVGFDW